MAAEKDKLAEAILNAEDDGRQDRSDIEQTWQSVARFAIPRRATFTEEVSKGVERERFILDSTAARSLELFASFLHTLLNNPALQWFRIQSKDRSLRDKNLQVRKWMEEVEERMLSAMSSREMNLYVHLHTTYIDLGAFGTSVMYAEQRGGAIRSRAFHLKDCVYDEDESGTVDTMFRQLDLKPRQARQRWPGVDLGRNIMDTQKKTRKEKVRFVHAVFPTSDPQFADLLPDEVKLLNTPWASVWINAKDRVTVSVGGFEEFPYMVPRWYTVRGDMFGRSPAMTVLPDIRMVNRMTDTLLRGAEKLVDPPLLLPDGGMVSPIRMFPGGISFSEGNVTPQPLIPPGASRIEIGDGLIKQRQDAIREGFFVPLFITPDSPVKTATQVLQEVDERNRAISPMLIRIQGELFHPLITRIFGMMNRAGMFPPMPRVLQEAGLDIEYVSPLAASQRQIEGLATLRLFEGLAPWAQTDPSIFDNFDPDQVADVVHLSSGAPARIVRSKAAIKARRAQRAEELSRKEEAETAANSIEAQAKLAAAQR